MSFTPTLHKPIAVAPTRDNVSHLALKQEIFSRNVAKLIEFIYSKNYKCTLGECFRTHEQAAIYARSGLGILHSQHCQRLAIDYNLVDPQGNFCFDEKHYEQFGKYWESLHPSNRAGCFWKHRVDSDHVEMD